MVRQKMLSQERIKEKGMGKGTIATTAGFAGGDGDGVKAAFAGNVSFSANTAFAARAAIPAPVGWWGGGRGDGRRSRCGRSCCVLIINTHPWYYVMYY